MIKIKKSKRSFPYFLIFAVVVVTLIGAVYYSVVLYPKYKLNARKTETFSKIESKIFKASSEWQGDLAVVFKDLSYPEIGTTFNSSKKMIAASIVKIPIMAVTFELINEKKFALETILVLEDKDVIGGSGKIKAMDLPKQFTIEELLDLMIASSDNTATNKIIDLIGIDLLNKSFKDMGLKQTVLERKMMDFSMRRKGFENYICADDIVFLLEQIYTKKLVNEEFSNLALKFLKNQKVNDRIPKLLPEEVVVAHKTGLEKGVVHDAGIVFCDKGNYIICVLTGAVKSYKEGKSFIADLSLALYDLYE